MPADNAFGMLVTAAYWSAARGDWAAFLDVYARCFPHTKSSLSIFDPVDGRVNALLTVNFEPAEISKYGAYYARLNPWVSMAAGTDLWGVTWGHHTVPFETLRRTEFYNDWVRRQDDAAAGFGVNVMSRGGRSFVITNNFRLRDWDAGLRQAALAERLQPHLRRAFDLQRLTGGLPTAPHLLEQALERIGHAAFVLDRNERLLLANAPALDLLRAGEIAASGPGGRLRLTDAGDAAALSRALALLAAGTGPPPLWTLRCATPGRRIAVVAPLIEDLEDSALAKAFARPTRSAAIFIVVDAPRAAQAAALRRTLGLTPRQWRFAEALASGEALPDIAARRGADLATIEGEARALAATLGGWGRIDRLDRMLRADGAGREPD